MKKVTRPTNRTIPIEIYGRLVNGVMSFLYGQGNQKADGSVGLLNARPDELPTRVYFLKKAIRDYERSDDYKDLKEKWGSKVIFKSYKRWLNIINKYYPVVTLGGDKPFDIRVLNKNIKENRKEFHKQIQLMKEKWDLEKKGSLKIISKRD